MEKVHSDLKGHVFRCDRKTAQIVNPAVQFLNQPIPEFVNLLRTEGDEQPRKAIIRMFGMFSHTLYSHVSLPLWREFPELEPEAHAEVRGTRTD